MVASGIIETFLTRFMRRQVRRILTFPSLPSGEPLTAPPPGDEPLLLYLHIPFCEELCPYCSFNRVRLEPVLAARYFTALRAEMRRYAELGYRFDEGYVGGGTPTVLPAELAETLHLARELWPLRSLSVETNPNHLEPPILRILAECRVDRLSVGVQTFDDSLLKTVHRYHRYGSGEEIRKRIAAARGRFPTLNVDLIFNFAGQTGESLRRDLEVLSELEVDQVTFYPLMSPRAQRGPRSQEKTFYGMIHAALAGKYRRATAWCFSRARGEPTGRLSDEYIVSREEYAGLGSGSFGYLGGVLYANTFSLPRYIEQLGRGELPIAGVRRFSARERLRYDFLLKLFGGRLELAELEVRHGRDVGRKLAAEVAFFRAIRALRREGRSLVLTDRGNYVWVILMREFFTGVNRLRETRLAESERGA